MRVTAPQSPLIADHAPFLLRRPSRA